MIFKNFNSFNELRSYLEQEVIKELRESGKIPALSINEKLKETPDLGKGGSL